MSATKPKIHLNEEESKVYIAHWILRYHLATQGSATEGMERKIKIAREAIAEAEAQERVRISSTQNSHSKNPGLFKAASAPIIKSAPLSGFGDDIRLASPHPLELIEEESPVMVSPTSLSPRQ
jgi:hypothetical protein